MKKLPKKLAVIFVVFIAMIVLSFGAVLTVVDWLKGSDQPVPAQAIIILAGPPSRSFYAAELYNQGYVKDVYVTRPAREDWFKLIDELGIYFPKTEQMQYDVLIKKGVPAKHIHVVGGICKSTVDEAEVANSVFKGKDCHILVVTSPYHVKRAQMIFENKMDECRFKVLATPYETFHKKWWTDQDSARNVLLEVTKIAFYKLGGAYKNSKGTVGRGRKTGK